MRSIKRTLTLSLSGAALFIFMTALVIVVQVDVSIDGATIVCETATAILDSAIKVDQGGVLKVSVTDEMAHLAAKSPDLWYGVSLAGQLIERSPDTRPALPFSLPYKGPRGRLIVDTTDGKGSVCLNVTRLDRGDLVVMVGGARVGFRQFVVSFVVRNLAPIALIAAAFAAIVATGALLSARFVGRSIERVTRLALAIEPAAPHKPIPLDAVPVELAALVTALNGAFAEIDGHMSRQRRFLGNAAHEMRTPLTLLRAKVETLPQVTVKTELVRDIRRLGTLVTAMLDLARLQGEAVDPADVDLLAVTRDVLADFSPSALDNGIDLSLDEDGHGPFAVQGHEAAIRSAVANLVGNALLHARSATHVAAVVGNQSICISDDGEGLPVGLEKDLVEPFQKGPQSIEGAGLGLSIVSEIMIAHGGSLTLKSEPGRGTTARLRFS